MTALDPRLTLARADLAAAELEGLVRAARYAQTTPMTCQAPAAAIRRAGEPAAEQMDQLLYGEVFEVLEDAGAWVWGQARRDGYVGYVERASLAPVGQSLTHRVRALRAYAFSEASIKSRPLGLYSMNGLVCVWAREGRFAQDAQGGWFVETQLAPIGEFEDDPASVAEAFVGAAYQWGGRESLGLDCSGLVQQALFACGLACPRDTDMQAKLGRAITAEDLMRGDLVFWRGHVGMMLDQTRLIHANAHHMAVVIEPLAEAVVRISASGSGEPTAYRRLAT